MEQSQFLPFPRQNPDNLQMEGRSSAKQRHKHIMGKLKDTIFTTLSASNPTGGIRKETKSHIEKQLHKLFPHFGTPSHPPYALMIRTAITKLNEEGGSTEESISGFIGKEYEDLPWGHTAFLSHHLRKLSGTREIVGKNDGRYVINVDCCDFGDEEGTGHGMNIRQGREILHTCHVGDGFQTELKEKIREDCRLIKQKIEAESQVGGKEIEVLNKWIEVKEKQIEVCEQCCQVEKQEVEEESEVSRWDFDATVQQSPSMELIDEEKYFLQNQQVVLTEHPNHMQILQFEVSDGHNLECGQQTTVMEDQSTQQETREQQIEVKNEKKMEDQILVTTLCASQTIGQCLDCNGSSYSLKLVKKKIESQEQLMENSHSLWAMELPEYDNSRPVMEEEKDYLKVDQQQLIKCPCTENASNIEVIEGQKSVQEQEDKLNKQASQPHQLQIEDETKLFELCCYNRAVNKNFWDSDSPLPLAKKEQKVSLKLEQQQTMSTLGEKQFIIVCGLQAQKLSQQKIFGQQKELNSNPNIEQKKQPEIQAGRSCLRPKLDVDKTMSVLLPSDHVCDSEQQRQCQPECQGQGRPSKPGGNGDHHQSLRIYVRRRRRL